MRSVGLSLELGELTVEGVCRLSELVCPVGKVAERTGGGGEQPGGGARERRSW